MINTNIEALMIVIMRVFFVCSAFYFHKFHFPWVFYGLKKISESQQKMLQTFLQSLETILWYLNRFNPAIYSCKTSTIFPNLFCISVFCLIFFLSFVSTEWHWCTKEEFSQSDSFGHCQQVHPNQSCTRYQANTKR